MIKRTIIGLGLAVLVVGIQGCTSSKEKAEKEAQLAEQAAEARKPKPGEMVLVPAGKFKMGSNEKDEKGATPAFPERELELAAFYIDKYEVTNGEFLKFSAATGYVSEAEEENKSWRLFYSADREHYPAVNLTWADAAAYAKWAGKRLPTEAEWEKAARGSDGRRFPWGNEWQPGRSNTSEAGFKQARAVGTYVGDESPYGAIDMLGNVQEWCEDWYKAYPGNTKKEEYYGEKMRVARGATANHTGKLFSLWMRAAYLPKGLFGQGLRCVRDAPKATMRTDPNDRQRELDRLSRLGFRRIILALQHPSDLPSSF